MSERPSFPVTGDPAADELLVEDPLALLLGMMLDQQVPMEWAFMSPHRLRERMGAEHLDARTLAEMPPDELEKLFKGPPALHRFPGAMAKRAQEVCHHLVDHYDGDAAGLWRDPASGAELVKRVQALPGFGKEKARIFCALLAKRFGLRPEGWEEATAPFSDDQPRSVADIDSRESFDRVRAWKKAMKAQGKGKSD
jgi:uncharacterized HhH-GPD family protein